MKGSFLLEAERQDKDDIGGIRRHSETEGTIEIDCHPQSFATTQANQLNPNESTTQIKTLKRGYKSFAESYDDIQTPAKPQYFKKHPNQYLNPHASQFQNGTYGFLNHKSLFYYF